MTCVQKYHKAPFGSSGAGIGLPCGYFKEKLTPVTFCSGRLEIPRRIHAFVSDPFLLGKLDARHPYS